MKPTFKFKILLLLLGCVAARQLSAQSGGDAGPAIHFRLLSWEDVISDLKFGSASTPVTILPNTRSPFYEYKGADPLVFFRIITGPDGKPQKQEAAALPPDQFRDNILLLFFRTPNVPNHYDVMAVDDGADALPGGSYRVLNFSRAPLNVKIGASGDSVSPSQSLVIPGAPAGGGETTFISISVASGSQQRPVYTNWWPYSQTIRTLVLVFLDPKSRTYELKRIIDDIAVLPKARTRR